MVRIRLPRGEWSYDPGKPIGKPGGFGAVYVGYSDSHGELAVKRLHLSANDAAHREIRIATDLAGRALNNVIPVLDAGEDADSNAYFVVMPRAVKSLQDEINQSAKFADLEAAEILLQITDGLIEVGDIVHRDLKPANILFHQGRWKIADFGIARFVEESTSLQTLKDCLTPQYAAPEQWQYIRATTATDVYALGCIGFTLFTGSPPFTARTKEELREQHLNADPPSLSQAAPRLRSLLTMMLRKPPDARPNLQRVKAILDGFIKNPPNPAGESEFGLLAEAGANVARVQAEADRIAQQLLSETQARKQRVQTGRKILAETADRLLSRIETEAPVAKRRDYVMTLGQAFLRFGPQDSNFLEEPLPANAFQHSKWDVVAGEEIAIVQGQPEYRWSASLWYCCLPNTSEYRWYEASYFAPLRGEAVAPYSLTKNVEDADLAASPVMHVFQLAFGPRAIDDENEPDFIERWAALLALASQGKLRHPQNLPLHDQFWR